MDSSVTNRVASQLRTMGVEVALDPDHPSVTLTRGRSTQRYAMILGAGRSEVIHGRLELPTLLFTHSVDDKESEWLRRLGIQHADTAGNAWIEFGDVLIDVRGRAQPRKQARPQTPSIGNLFSSRRSQVIFALLAWPELWHSPQRELARVSGASVGQVNSTLMLLAETGFHAASSDTTSERLLVSWAAAYPTGLSETLELGRFHGSVSDVQAFNGTPIFVSGEAAAADDLKPNQLTLYVDELDSRLPIINRWRTDGELNIFVRRRFWEHPDDMDASGIQLAPWPLVYADLLASSNPRARSVAKSWKSGHQHVGHQL